MRKNHPIAILSDEELRETHSIGRQTREWIVTPQMSSTLSECGIFLIGWSEAREGFRFVRPRFPLSQVLVCTEGIGDVWVDGAWMECGAGMAYLTPPHVFHAYRARPEGVWTIYWVTYHAAVVDGKAPLLLRTDPGPLAAAIRHLYGETTGVADRHTISQWSQLVHTSASRVVRPLSYEPRLRRLWHRVSERPDIAWDVTNLAAAIGISGEHLRRLCQQEHGCGPMEHVTQIRMQHAVALLASGYYTVTAVSERVGYSSPFAFSAAFKRVLGVSPSLYVTTKLSASG